MKPRQLLILAVLAAVSVGTTAAVRRAGTPTVTSDRRGERVLPKLLTDANAITGLTVRQGADTLTIERRDRAFVAADSGFPVKLDAVRDVVTSSIELAFEEARTSDPSRYGELGIADPGAVAEAGKEIIVRAASGDLADFVVGNRDSTVGGAAGGVFVRLQGEPQTWLARGSVRLPASRADWFAAVDLGIKGAEIRKVELAGGGRDGVTAAASAEKPGELKLDNVPEKRTPEPYKVGRLPGLIENFNFQDVRKQTKAADDARRMTVQVSDGLRLTVTSVGDLAGGWVQIKAEAAGDAKDDKAVERAKQIAAKVDGYDFRLSASQAEVLGWTATELTSEAKS
jgi:hypothetical protein